MAMKAFHINETYYKFKSLKQFSSADADCNTVPFICHGK